MPLLPRVKSKSYWIALTNTPEPKAQNVWKFAENIYTRYQSNMAAIPYIYQSEIPFSDDCALVSFPASVAYCQRFFRAKCSYNGDYIRHIYGGCSAYKLIAAQFGCFCTRSHVKCAVFAEFSVAFTAFQPCALQKQQAYQLAQNFSAGKRPRHCLVLHHSSLFFDNFIYLANFKKINILTINFFKGVSNVW